jgi:hypothetical protein
MEHARQAAATAPGYLTRCDLNESTTEPPRQDHAAPTLTGFIKYTTFPASSSAQTVNRVEEGGSRPRYCSVAHFLSSTFSIVGKWGKIKGNLAGVWHGLPWRSSRGRIERGMPGASVAPARRMSRAVGRETGEGVAREAREMRGVRIGQPAALAGGLALGNAALDHAQSVAAFAARLAS